MQLPSSILHAGTHTAKLFVYFLSFCFNVGMGPHITGLKMFFLKNVFDENDHYRTFFRIGNPPTPTGQLLFTTGRLDRVEVAKTSKVASGCRIWQGLAGKKGANGAA
jgi:hypothetical protein